MSATGGRFLRPSKLVKSHTDPQFHTVEDLYLPGAGSEDAKPCVGCIQIAYKSRNHRIGLCSLVPILLGERVCVHEPLFESNAQGGLPVACWRQELRNAAGARARAGAQHWARTCHSEPRGFLGLRGALQRSARSISLVLFLTALMSLRVLYNDAVGNATQYVYGCSSWVRLPVHSELCHRARLARAVPILVQVLQDVEEGGAAPLQRQPAALHIPPPSAAVALPPPTPTNMVPAPLRSILVRVVCTAAYPAQHSQRCPAAEVLHALGRSAPCTRAVLCTAVLQQAAQAPSALAEPPADCTPIGTAAPARHCWRACAGGTRSPR